MRLSYIVIIIKRMSSISTLVSTTKNIEVTHRFSVKFEWNT